MAKPRVKKKPRTSKSGRRGLKPGQTHSGSFQPGVSGNLHRGPDTIPSKPVIARVQLAALMNEQFRDPRTGRVSRSKWARGGRGGGMLDFLNAHRRLLYQLAEGDPEEAARLASAVARTGEYFGAYLDDKPATGPRTTIFMSTNAAPNKEIPPEQGRLSAAEGAFEEVREEEVP